eukprot:TRINITY_DN114416_c0_g1_i1.p1 TRINITY_DN114416_c0_g1~~TRINITY_DN114416_c0_g1_i1.p1  ORF type:complete len:292 (-),score=48.31 TRINITY_DN114416_c0_g1_i1:75-950(-)
MALTLYVTVLQQGDERGTFSIEANEEDDIITLKRAIEDQEGILAEKQHIVFHTWTGNKGWTHRFTREDELKKLSTYCSPHEQNSVLLKYQNEEGEEYRVPPFPRRIEQQKIVIIVDVSGSMNKDIIVDGDVMSRYDYCQTVVRRALESIPEESTFNIIYYSDQVYEVWQGAMKPATQENVDEAVTELADLIPGGGTNTRDALSFCFKDYIEHVDAFYFVTDGRPDSNPDLIINKVIQRNMEHFRPVHCICFTPSAADFACEKFLMNLSSTTNGTYRCPNLTPAPTGGTQVI